jgi:hypothetical protein
VSALPIRDVTYLANDSQCYFASVVSTSPHARTPERAELSAPRRGVVRTRAI